MLVLVGGGDRFLMTYETHVSRTDRHRAIVDAHIYLLHADGVEELVQKLVGILLAEIEVLVVLNACAKSTFPTIACKQRESFKRNLDH